jgi:nitroreductase
MTYWPEDWVRSYKRHCLPPFPLNQFVTSKFPEGASIVAFHGWPHPHEAIAGYKGERPHHRALPTPAGNPEPPLPGRKGFGPADFNLESGLKNARPGYGVAFRPNGPPSSDMRPKKKLSILKRIKNSRFAIDLYYAFIDRSFRREHAAVVAGKLAHIGSGATLEAQRFLLRRNIHRLEKGLIMRPPKPVFALDYIEETVAAYERIAAADACEASRADEFTWFTSVLARYFTLVGEGARVAACRERFRRAGAGVAAGDGRSIPYPAATRPANAVAYDDFLLLCRRRRSVRWFQDRPVPRELIDRAVDAARLAPSACNRQPFQFVVETRPEEAAKIGAIPMGTQGFSDNFPAIAVLVGDLSAYFDERDRHLIYIDGALAAMQFMLACETLGLSTCPINWPDIEDREKRMDAALWLQTHERPIMLIALGYANPDGGVPFSGKRSVEHLRRYI